MWVPSEVELGKATVTVTAIGKTAVTPLRFEIPVLAEKPPAAKSKK